MRFRSAVPLTLVVALAGLATLGPGLSFARAGRAASARPASAAAPAARIAPAKRRFDNSVLHVEIVGHGRPILFLPGLASSGDVWRDAVSRHAGGYECHVVTLGGFAGEPRFEGPFLDTARDSLLAYLREERLEHPVIVGHSLGGVLALQLAIAAPDAIGPLVILDALPFLGGAGRGDATPESARQAMAPLRDMIRGQTQEAYAAFQRQSPYLHAMVTDSADYQRVLEWACVSDHAAVADGIFDVGTLDLRDSLAAIRSPILVLGTWYGLRGQSTREAVEATFRSQFAKAPRCSIAIADSARHFLMLDAPDWTWSRVDAFLGECATTAPRTGSAR